MSVEEDAELKNLVAQTLENKGILPKIRAELRANVFLALEENPSTKETLLKNDELSAFVKIPIGSLILNLVREFLEFFELEFTLSVFDPETKYGKEYNSMSKENMIKELKLGECKEKNPLLFEVIKGVISSNEKMNEISSIDVLAGGGSGQPSPVGLNCTYVKKDDSVPVSPIDESKEASCESDSPKNQEVVNGMTELSSPNQVPKPIEIDLLTFTPVKEKSEVEVEKSSRLSILGDLPPLTSTVDEKGDKISEIKAMIDKWPGLENDDEFSLESKSSKDQVKSLQKSDCLSHKSDKTESAEDFEEEISDLINGHTPSDSQVTVDETISKASSAADYLESL